MPCQCGRRRIRWPRLRSRSRLLAGLDLASHNTQLIDLSQVEAAGRATHAQSAHSLRVYSIAEQDHLGAACLGFVSFLESAGVLPPHMREIVVDRAMAVPGHPVSIDDLKIIVLMVYWSAGLEPDALILDELFVAPEDRVIN